MTDTMAAHMDMIRMARMQTFQDKMPELFERAREAKTRDDNRNLSRIVQRIVDSAQRKCDASIQVARTHVQPTTRLDLIARAHMEHFNTVYGCYRAACVGRAISPKRRAALHQQTYRIEWNLYTWTVCEDPSARIPMSLIDQLLDAAEKFCMDALKLDIYKWQYTYGAHATIEDRLLSQEYHLPPPSTTLRSLASSDSDAIIDAAATLLDSI